MPDTDPTADAFMARILADPTDPLPRLVFADWLEETGTASNVAWARFLRLAEELASAPAADPRRPKLAGELERVGGLVRARLTCRAEVLVAHPEGMLRLLPRRCFTLDVSRVSVPRSVCDLVDPADARGYGYLPLAVADGRLCVAVPTYWHGMPGLVYHLYRRPELPIPALAHQLADAIDRHYPTPPPPAAVLALNPAA
jgi:uncharacterized protein (TIGR02996 family)